MRAWMAVACCFLASFSARMAFADEGLISLPESATRMPAGERITLNGLPIKMVAFSSPESEKELLAWFSKRLGAPVTIDKIGSVWILGKMINRRYVTVQLKPALGVGVEGFAAATSFDGIRSQLSAYREQLAHWLRAWPAGSEVLSDMSSEEAGQYLRHIVVRNAQNEEINSSRLKSILARDGYQLEREALGDAKEQGEQGGRVLYFKGAGREAVATISDNSHGQTITVLQTTRLMEGE